MSATAKNPTERADAGLELDWRWGFEPEAWMSLRSKKAMMRRPAAPPDVPAQPTAGRFSRIAHAIRALLGT